MWTKMQYASRNKVSNMPVLEGNMDVLHICIAKIEHNDLYIGYVGN